MKIGKNHCYHIVTIIPLVHVTTYAWFWSDGLHMNYTMLLERQPDLAIIIEACLPRSIKRSEDERSCMKVSMFMDR